MIDPTTNQLIALGMLLVPVMTLLFMGYKILMRMVDGFNSADTTTYYYDEDDTAEEGKT